MNRERWTSFTDGAMTTLGLVAASWVFFIRDTQNPYVYLLILVLLRRVTPEAIDKVLGKVIK